MAGPWVRATTTDWPRSPSAMAWMSPSSRRRSAQPGHGYSPSRRAVAISTGPRRREAPMCDPQVLPGRAGLRHDHRGRRHDLAAAWGHTWAVHYPGTGHRVGTGFGGDEDGPAGRGAVLVVGGFRSGVRGVFSEQVRAGAGACCVLVCPDPSSSMACPSPADDYWGGVRRGCSTSDRFPVGSLTASPCRSHITCRRDFHDVPCGAETSIPTARRRAGADHWRADIICTRPASCIPTRRCTSSRIKTGSTEAFCSTCC